MQWSRCSFVVLAAFAIGGCEKPVAANVPGIYRADYEGDRDTLELRADGSYRHVIGSLQSAPVDEGQWMIETPPGESLGLSLEKFRFRDHGGGLKRPGWWFVEIEVTSLTGQYRLCFDPDLGSCFVRDR